MTNLEKYKIICKLYKEFLTCKHSSYDLPLHTHHIKPKSIYPELKDDRDNKVELPAIVHAAAHHFLSKFAEETDDERFKNIHYADVVGFINENLKDRVFSFDDNVADEIFSSIVDSFLELMKSALNASKEYEKDRVFITGFVKEKGLSVVNVRIVNRHDSISKQYTLDEVNEINEKFEVFRSCFKNESVVNPEKPSTIERHQKYLLLLKYPYRECPCCFYEAMYCIRDMTSQSLQEELDDIFIRHSTHKKDILDLDVSLSKLFGSNEYDKYANIINYLDEEADTEAIRQNELNELLNEMLV